MKQSQLSIHSENILPIIKKWLYSDKDMFLRELVSNATDALSKMKILSPEEGSFTISIEVNKEEKTLTISDTGIGMSEEEVEKYIAQIAFSGAQEFAQKYQSQTAKDPIIGHFGLGFYSAYMVAKNVEIETKSYKTECPPVRWVCDGSSSYSIGPGSRSERGTSIKLYLDEESLEYLEESKLSSLLAHHSSFMPFSIQLNERTFGGETPLWMKPPSECEEKEYLAFYRKLFPFDPEPIFWVHLNVDYPFHLQGILYFPKAHKRFEQKESNIKLFCNRVFVSESCKELLPDYLMSLKGAIDSPDIPLNVSRSYLQVDQNVRQLSSHISKKISDKLSQTYKAEKQKYIDSWPEIEVLIKLGSLQDAKFYERVQDILIWENKQGSWDPISKESKKVFYSTTKNSPLLNLYNDVIFATSPIDIALIQFLEEKLEVSFQRIDGALDESLIDASKEKSLLDSEGRTESSRIAEFIQKSLSGVEVEAKSLVKEDLPGLIIFEEAQRRFRDYIHLTQGQKGDTKKTFVVNTNNQLIQAIYKLQQQKPEIAASLAQGVYDLSLLFQKEIGADELSQIAERQTKILRDLLAVL